MQAVFNAEAPQETVDGFVKNFTEFAAKLDARWADGRAHATGANITAADYKILSDFTAIVSNTNLKTPAVSTSLMEVYNSHANYKRVVDNIKSECQATVDALAPSFV